MMDEQHQQKRECKKANRQKRQQKFHQQQAGNDMGIITGAHHEDQVPADQVPAVHVKMKPILICMQPTITWQVPLIHNNNQ